MAVCVFVFLSGIFTAVLGATETRFQDDIIGMAVGATLAFIFLVVIVFLVWIGTVWQKWYREIQSKKGRIKISREQIKYEKQLKHVRKLELRRATAKASSDVSIRDVPKYIYTDGSNKETQSVTMEMAGAHTGTQGYHEIQERSIDLGYEQATDDVVITRTSEIHTSMRHGEEIPTSQGGDEVAFINKAFSVLDDDVKPVNSMAKDDAVLIL